jgi:hypothetical protein
MECGANRKEAHSARLNETHQTMCRIPYNAQSVWFNQFCRQAIRSLCVCRRILNSFHEPFQSQITIEAKIVLFQSCHWRVTIMVGDILSSNIEMLDK